MVGRSLITFIKLLVFLLKMLNISRGCKTSKLKHYLKKGNYVPISILWVCIIKINPETNSQVHDEKQRRPV